MNRSVFLSFVSVQLLLVYSCSMITDSSNEPELRFEHETFIVDGKVIDTYRSLDVISIGLKTDIDLNEFNEYIESTGLQLIRIFSHSQYTTVTEKQLQGSFPLILLLPSNVDRSQFYSFSKNLKESSFAKNPFIKYSLPAYTHDTEHLSWYYPTNKLAVKPLTDDFSVSELSKQFNLEFQSKSSQIDLYYFTDNQFLHGSPYELARNIYDSGKYRYVVPNGFREIVQH